MMKHYTVFMLVCDIYKETEIFQFHSSIFINYSNEKNSVKIGFTTSINIYLTIGMNNKHQYIPSHMLLIIHVKKLKLKKRIIIWLIYFNFKAFYWE